MADKINTTNFTIYKMITEKREHLRVAVSKKFEMEIEKLLNEFGSMEKIPVDKTVRGIFLEETDHVVDPEKQENDITINQLRQL